MTTIKASLGTVRDLLLGVAWGPLARGAWCRRQRLLLGRPDHGVVWLGHEVLPWAEWGAARGYFDLHHMSGLPYLMTAAGGCSPRGEVETRARRANPAYGRRNTAR